MQDALRLIKALCANRDMAKSPVVDSIKAKAERLMAENRRLRDEYETLSRKADKMRTDNREFSRTIAELESKISVLELAGAMSGEAVDNKAARARINRLMREVDKCIALLNR